MKIWKESFKTDEKEILSNYEKVNIYKSKSEHKCIILDKGYLNNQANRPFSIYFTHKMKRKPKVIVGVSGIEVKNIKLKDDDDTVSDLYFKMDENTDVYTDHFDIQFNFDTKKYKVEEIQICYFAIILNIFE